MDKTYREKVTVALQKLEQYGGKVSWWDVYSVICILEYNFVKTVLSLCCCVLASVWLGYMLGVPFSGLNMFLNKIYSCKKLLFAVIDDACLFPLILYCLFHFLRESGTHIPAQPG